MQIGISLSQIKLGCNVVTKEAFDQKIENCYLSYALHGAGRIKFIENRNDEEYRSILPISRYPVPLKFPSSQIFSLEGLCQPHQLDPNLLISERP